MNIFCIWNRFLKIQISPTEQTTIWNEIAISGRYCTKNRRKKTPKTNQLDIYCVNFVISCLVARRHLLYQYIWPWWKIAALSAETWDFAHMLLSDVWTVGMGQYWHRYREYSHVAPWELNPLRSDISEKPICHCCFAPRNSTELPKRKSFML